MIKEIFRCMLMAVIIITVLLFIFGIGGILYLITTFVLWQFPTLEHVAYNINLTYMFLRLSFIIYIIVVAVIYFNKEYFECK